MLFHPAHIRLWWHTLDRWLLFSLLALAGIGIWLVFAASPAVAMRINLDKFYFVGRHVLVLAPTLLALLLLSLQSPRAIRVLGGIGLALSLAATVATLFMGVEIKGASRWLQLPGLSLQPSEFLKPFFAVAIAWLFARRQARPHFPAQHLAIALYIFCAGTLVLQPDMGMTAVLTVSWVGQCILAGLPWVYVGALAAFAVVGALGAYAFSSHVQARVDKFLDPTAGDTYQIQKAVDAFANGGLMGTGPGEGSVKMQIPDAHADFIFAVAGEELGFVICTAIVLAFAGILLRGFWRAAQQKDLFVLLAVAGIMMQFGLQTLVNLASTLHLIPTKGMTLPFISYGGSSLLATAVAMGIVLALTRQHTPTIHLRGGR